MTDKPSVLFVCVHNAGRSQMAAGFLTHLGGGRVEVRSAGSIPGDQVNPSAVAAMAEVGIDISAQRPKILTTGAVQASDVVITMGCGDACPIFPGKRYLDWVPVAGVQLADADESTLVSDGHHVLLIASGQNGARAFVSAGVTR